MVAYILDEGNWHSLDTLPTDVQSVSLMNDQLLISLRSAWTTGETTHPSGSLLAVGVNQFIDQGVAAPFTALFAPPADDRVSLSDFVVTKNYVIVEALDNVRSRLSFWKMDGITWVSRGGESEGVTRGLSMSALDARNSDEYWVTVSSFVKVCVVCFLVLLLPFLGAGFGYVHNFVPGGLCCSIAIYTVLGECNTRMCWYVYCPAVPVEKAT